MLGDLTKWWLLHLYWFCEESVISVPVLHIKKHMHKELRPPASSDRLGIESMPEIPGCILLGTGACSLEVLGRSFCLGFSQD